MMSAYEAALKSLQEGGGRPRVVSLAEVMSGCGAGWIEWTVPAEPDEGMEACHTEERCAWCHGGVVSGTEGEYTDQGYTSVWYGREFRIWDGEPATE